MGYTGVVQNFVKFEDNGHKLVWKISVIRNKNYYSSRITAKNIIKVEFK